MWSTKTPNIFEMRILTMICSPHLLVLMNCNPLTFIPNHKLVNLFLEACSEVVQNNWDWLLTAY
jgi:hypothetical protein